jgi:hypothetical protein
MILGWHVNCIPQMHVALAIDRISPASPLDRRPAPGIETEKGPAPSFGMESRRKSTEVAGGLRGENNAVHHLLEIGFLFILLV